VNAGFPCWRSIAAHKIAQWSGGKQFALLVSTKSGHPQSVNDFILLPVYGSVNGFILLSLHFGVQLR